MKAKCLWMTVGIALVLMLVAPAGAVVNHDIFSIVLNADNSVNFGYGSGFAGGTWFEYPQPDGLTWWNQWFYDDPVLPDHYKEIWWDIFIGAETALPPFDLEVAINWTTEDYQVGPTAGPPIGPGAEDFIVRETIFSGTLFDGDVVFLADELIIPDYNPEWVSIDVRILQSSLPIPIPQVRIEGDIWHECIANDVPDGGATLILLGLASIAAGVLRKRFLA